MLKCKDAKDKMSLYIDNLLPEHELNDFEVHIQGCECCRNELEILETIVYESANLDKLELPANFKELLHNRLNDIEGSNVDTRNAKASKNTPWYFDWRAYSGIAAGILILAVVKNYYIDTNYLSQKAYVYEADLGKANGENKAYEAGIQSSNDNISIADNTTASKSSTANDLNSSISDNKSESNKSESNNSGSSNSGSSNNKSNKVESDSIAGKNIEQATETNNTLIKTEIRAQMGQNNVAIPSESNKATVDNFENNVAQTGEAYKDNLSANMESPKAVEANDSSIAPKAKGIAGTKEETTQAAGVMRMAEFRTSSNLENVQSSNITRELSFKTSSLKYNNILVALNSKGIAYELQDSAQGSDTGLKIIIIDSNYYEYMISLIEAQDIARTEIIIDEKSNVQADVPKSIKVNIEVI